MWAERRRVHLHEQTVFRVSVWACDRVRICYRGILTAFQARTLTSYVVPACRRLRPRAFLNLLQLALVSATRKHGNDMHTVGIQQEQREGRALRR